MDSQGKNPGQMGASAACVLQPVAGHPSGAGAAVPKMALTSDQFCDTHNRKLIYNSDLSPGPCKALRYRIRLNYRGSGQTRYGGRWRPAFGLVSLPEAEGKAVAAPTGYSSSTKSPPQAPREVVVLFVHHEVHTARQT